MSNISQISKRLSGEVTLVSRGLFVLVVNVIVLLLRKQGWK